MQALARSSPARPEEMQRFELLVATLSSQFARLHVEEISPAILGALERVGRAADVDACALIEFSDGESVNAVRAWPNAEAAFGNGGWPPPSLVDRLVRGEAAPVLGVDGVGAWEPARHSRDRSELGVPVMVGERVVCAVVFCAHRPSQGWPAPVVEWLRVIAEILGVALQRCRQEAALRASVATIERLNARLAADNAYLQEEIKIYHDFDDIVGDGAALRLALTRRARLRRRMSVLLAWRNRNRQGAVRAGPARSQSPADARAGQGQLRRAAADADRERAVRAREGLVHRRRRQRQGRFELADGGTHLSGRDRRAAARDPGQAAARAAGRRVRARRRHPGPSASTCG